MNRIKKNTNEIAFVFLILSFSLIIASSIPVPLLGDDPDINCNSGWCSCECNCGAYPCVCTCWSGAGQCGCSCTGGNGSTCEGPIIIE